MTPRISLHNYLTAVLDDNSFSNDIPFITSKYKLLPLFVYGTEKRRFSEEHVLKGSVRIGIGYTAADIFELRITPDAEPVVFSNPGTPDSNRISGELYLVSPEDLIRLDSRYSNGIIFRRRQQMISWVALEEKDLKVKPQYVSEAYIYLGEREYWRNRTSIAGMKFGKLCYPTSGGRPYYVFTALCDKPNKDAMARKARQCL